MICTDSDQNKLDVKYLGKNLADLMLVSTINAIEWSEPYPFCELSGLKEPTILASDVFGDLYVEDYDRIHLIRLETGDVEEVWENQSDWINDLIAHPDGYIGVDFLVEWEGYNGSLLYGSRLTPKKPLSLGGTYDLANFHACAFDELVAFRGMFAQQMRGIPIGATVQLKVTD